MISKQSAITVAKRGKDSEQFDLLNITFGAKCVTINRKCV